MIRPELIDHLVFRVSDLDRSELFYSALLGQPFYRAEDSLMYKVGETRLFFTSSDEPKAGIYDKEKVGLNHVAFGVRSLVELEALQTQLDSARISHSGIKLDQHGLKEFIWLDDPDGLRLEFYLRPEQD